MLPVGVFNYNVRTEQDKFQVSQSVKSKIFALNFLFK